MRLYFSLLCVFVLHVACAQTTGSYASVPDWYRHYDIKFYKIDIEVDNTTTNIKGYGEVLAEVTESSLAIFPVELAEDILVDSVYVDGQPVRFTRQQDVVNVHLPQSLSKGELCRVKVFYAAIDIKDDGFFSAVRTDTDSKWNVPVTWTLSQPYNAKKWFPCKQYLPDKADSAHIFLTVPDHLKAGAPGLLTAVTPVGSSKLRYEWKTKYPTAYYLLSFAVSEYRDYSFTASPKGVSAPVPVQNYIYDREGYLDAHQAVIDSTKALIELFSELYTPYPFADEKYGHCTAPMGGGMEHQTMTTISDFDFLLVAHELAHQWFGDLVTCSSFQDVWINEGFATYSEFLALEYLGSYEDALSWMERAHAMATWSQTGSVFVPAKSAGDTWRIFSMSLSYKKGAALVHNIRGIINNDDTFFAVLRGFLNKYSFSTASGLEFKAYLEEQTGMDFTLFFDQWYFGEGFPVFDISWKKDNGTVEMLVEHKGSAPATPVFAVDLNVRLVKNNGASESVQLPIRTNRDMFSFRVEEDITDIEPDPDYYVVKQLRSVSQVKDLPTDDTFVDCNTHLKRRQNLVIRFATETGRNCSVRLVNVKSGETITTVNAKRKKTLEIPMDEVPDGAYLLYVENNKEQYVRKIVKSIY